MVEYSTKSLFFPFLDDVDQLRKKCDFYRNSLFKKVDANAKLRQRISRQKKILTKQKQQIRMQQERIKGLLLDIEKQKLLDSDKTKELLNSISDTLAYKLIKREKRRKKYDMDVKTFAHTHPVHSLYSSCHTHLH